MGCSPAGSSTPIDQVEQGIIDGQVDSTDQATVAVLRSNPKHPEWDYLCSGTIVAKKGSTAFVLTAAHCTRAAREAVALGDPGPLASELYVVQGNDFATAGIQYPVTAFAAHPSYSNGPSGTVYDFAVLSITGAGPATPTLPFATAKNDSLVAGARITIVGYGRETHPGADGGPVDKNSVRHSLVRTVADLQPLLIGYTDVDGALTCNGDSGGSELAPVGGQPTVVGVTSFGGIGCYEYGYGGRVSAASDWIQAYIDGTANQTAQTCDECWSAATTGVGVCTSAVAACDADAECTALTVCFNACGAGDSACFRACETHHPAGSAKYNAIVDCTCTAPACATACKDTSCKKGCGLNFGTDTCASCVETGCCAENAACNGDATCQGCFGASPPAACGANAPYRALAHCIVSGCHNQCDFGKCGLSQNAPGCTACEESQCCAETLLCVGKQGCYDCALGFSTTGCNSIPEFQAYGACLRQKCGAPAACDIPALPVALGTGGASPSRGSGGGGATGAGGATSASGTSGSSGLAGLGTNASPTTSSGCGCRTSSGSSPRSWTGLLAVVAAAFLRRKRWFT